MDTSIPSPTIAILHGWAEGKWVSKKFVSALNEAGFTVVEDAKNADIIFAHSLGCYRVPADTRAKYIILAGMPVGANRSLPASWLRKLMQERAYHRDHKELVWWYGKLAHGFLCAIAGPRSHYYLLMGRTSSALPSSIDRKVILVHSEGDTFVSQNLETISKEMKYEYKNIPGMHDNCWLNPEPYVDVIRLISHN